VTYYRAILIVQFRGTVGTIGPARTDLCQFDINRRRLAGGTARVSADLRSA